MAPYGIYIPAACRGQLAAASPAVRYDIHGHLERLAWAVPLEQQVGGEQPLTGTLSIACFTILYQVDHALRRLNLLRIHASACAASVDWRPI
jgi:hypothetical protein